MMGSCVLTVVISSASFLFITIINFAFLIHAITLGPTVFILCLNANSASKDWGERATSNRTTVEVMAREDGEAVTGEAGREADAALDAAANDHSLSSPIAHTYARCSGVNDGHVCVIAWFVMRWSGSS